jgi:hypothetical protein
MSSLSSFGFGSDDGIVDTEIADLISKLQGDSSNPANALAHRTLPVSPCGDPL